MVWYHLRPETEAHLYFKHSGGLERRMASSKLAWVAQ
jgi:hypothetical protein